MARLTKEEFFKRQLEQLKTMKNKNKFITGKNVYEEIDNRISFIFQDLFIRKPITMQELIENIWAYQKIKKILVLEEYGTLLNEDKKMVVSFEICLKQVEERCKFPFDKRTKKEIKSCYDILNKAIEEIKTGSWN